MASMPVARGAVAVVSSWHELQGGQKQHQAMRFAASSLAEGRGRGGVMNWSSSCSWQGTRLAGPPAPSSVGQSRRGGVARSEQGDAGTSITTSSPPMQIELNKGGVTDVDKDTFWPIVQSAGEKVVVLDMYTQWCGPCKLMLPKIIQLAEKLDDVIFLKLDCNKYNKPLAKELGVRVVPTFKIFKYNELTGEVTGAKFPDLVAAIDKARSIKPVAT